MSKRWTVMVYLAGDNNLEGAGVDDLREMKQIGSSEDIDVVAQFDRMTAGATRRYHLRHGTPLDEDCVAELGETNCGDPALLIEFLSWGLQNYPAERTCFVLWNHGSGWKEDDIYRMARRAAPENAVSPAHARSLGSGKRTTFFSTTIETLLGMTEDRRAICFDDQSEDFLDNAELQRALRAGLASAGRDRLDVLGMDACLMTIVEVAYQVRGQCDCLVGSEEVEPGSGWPYHTILRGLVAHPEMSSREFSALIVRKYGEHYRRHAPNAALTQSGLDLRRIDSTVGAVDNLARCLHAALGNDNVYLDALFASKKAQRFFDVDYMDVTSYATLLAERTHDNSVRAAAEALAHAVTHDLVVAETHRGVSMSGARGVSIYCPLSGRVSEFYPRLDFCSATDWKDFLVAMS